MSYQQRKRRTGYWRPKRLRRCGPIISATARARTLVSRRQTLAHKIIAREYRLLWVPLTHVRDVALVVRDPDNTKEGGEERHGCGARLPVGAMTRSHTRTASNTTTRTEIRKNPATTASR